MSVATGWMAAAGSERLRAEIGRATFRVRLVKMLCGLVLAICFWYSVPYVLPFVPEHSIDRAAATASVAETGNLSRQIAMPIVALISLFLLWRLPKRGRIGGQLIYFATAYVVWAVMSVGWSDSPGLSTKRLVVFLFNILFAYMMARVFSLIEMALLGMCATGAVALIAFYSDAILQRIFAPRDPDYRFQGVTTANYQAMSLCVLLFCIVTLLAYKPEWAKRLWFAFGTAFVLLFMTRARMSTILAMLLFGIMLLRYARLRWKTETRAMVLIAALMLGVAGASVLVMKNGTDALQTVFMMGRNDTQNTSNLSNRGPLWQELAGSVAQRPLLGFGYDGFWSAARIARISADQGWSVPHAHNSYLDQTLSLGLIGVALYVGVMWSACWIAWKRYRHDHTETSLFAAVLLTWIVLQSLSESAPVDPYLPTLLAYACVAKMSLVPGSEAESDRFLAPHAILGGLTPADVQRLPADMRNDAVNILEGRKA
ncbi:MAG: O-antigen ligase family protein [Acidobacteriaceae bacterium]|nr:O-antigen ligase family protein [Acidobacteriaceae bacterium]